MSQQKLIPHTRSMVKSEVRRLSEIVSRSQLLAELARQSGRYGEVAILHKTAADAASAAAAYGRTYRSVLSLEAPTAPLSAQTSLPWLDDLMSGFVQTDSGWVRA